MHFCSCAIEQGQKCEHSKPPVGGEYIRDTGHVGSEKRRQGVSYKEWY